MKPQNKPGEPIVTRHKGAKFYCMNCEKEYRKCRCKVYISADTLPKVANLTVFGAGRVPQDTAE